MGGRWETEKVCHWERGIWSPEFREDLFALVQKIVYQGQQHNRDNQRTKRNLIRLQDIYNAIWLLERLGSRVPYCTVTGQAGGL